MTDKPWDHRPELLALVANAGLEMIPLHIPSAKDRKGRSIGKAPMNKNWRTMPALTLAQAQDHMERHGNIGVRLRDVDLVIDVDPRNYLVLEDGTRDDPLARLEKDTGLDLRSNYPIVRTGSGGLHIYMRKPPSALARDSLEEYQGVEFKTFGRQVVAPGSVHPDALKPYAMEDDLLGVPLTEAVDAPEALLRLIDRPSRLSTVDAGDMEPEQLAACLEVIDATQFQDHQKWLDMMMACHHATAGEGRQEFLEWSTSDPQYAEQAWSIGRRWDSLKPEAKGQRVVTQKTLFKFVLDAGKAAGERYDHLLPNATQRTTAQDDFKDLIGVIEISEDPEELDGNSVEPGDPNVGHLDRMNKEWCAVDDSGKFRVFRQKDDHDFKPPRKYWERYARSDFENLLDHKRLVSEDGKVTPLARKWMEYKLRKTYDGVVFDPAHRYPKEANRLNLWTDWAVTPSPNGSWKYLEEMIYEGLAGGLPEMGDYILNWIAFMIQNPDRQAEVALVFRGQKGVGKSTLGNILVELCGRHGIHISNSQHLTNNFNAHLRDCILLFSDEALWGGDKKAEGTLKQLITEPTILFEAKGRDAVSGRNMIHIVMASNEDWVIPASFGDERRFAVGDVSSKYRGNTAFWSALHRELNQPISEDDPRKSGLARFLWDMKMRDISTFHPRWSIPATLALARQKLTSLDDLHDWWWESLKNGSFGRSCKPIDDKGDWDDALGDGAWFFSYDLQESALEHCKRLGSRFAGRKAIESKIGQLIREMVGEHSTEKKRLKVPGDRFDIERHSDGLQWAYKIPSLGECRAKWESALGSRIDWDHGVPTY